MQGVRKFESGFTVLLRDYGYKVEGRTIIQKGIPGLTQDQIFGYCRGLMDAAEQLCPIIADFDYTTRLGRLQMEKK